eukprot:TRINITY_DN10136_c0_g1_i3.p1 TRINITY_DN10136_c0_g1~~TRINITY_DN10136_c0_g1_i3.p1  ORF type:complete len:202 (+),score=42.90 TRINITY_DN10136_c0_g1_i3:460-1065(+)
MCTDTQCTFFVYIAVPTGEGDFCTTMRHQQGPVVVGLFANMQKYQDVLTVANNWLKSCAVAVVVVTIHRGKNRVPTGRVTVEVFRNVYTGIANTLSHMFPAALCFVNGIAVQCLELGSHDANSVALPAPGAPDATVTHVRCVADGTHIMRLPADAVFWDPVTSAPVIPNVGVPPAPCGDFDFDGFELREVMHDEMPFASFP